MWKNNYCHLCILEAISHHKGRKRLVCYVQISLWRIFATYMRGKCSMTFNSIYHSRCMLWEKKLFIYNTYLWENTRWSRYWWKPGRMFSKERCDGRNKRLHLKANLLLHSQRTISRQHAPWPWIRDKGKSEDCKYEQVTPLSECLLSEEEQDSAFLNGGMLSVEGRPSHTFF